MKKFINQKGFTLIELLVIISIIAFLVSAVLLSLQNSRAKSRDARRVSDTKQITTGLALFYSKCGTYPINTTPVALTNLTKLYTGSSSGCGNKQGTDAANGGFGTGATGGDLIIAQMQSAPLPPDGSCTDASGSNRYTYTSDAGGSSYTLTFCIGKPTGDYTTDGVKTLRP